MSNTLLSPTAITREFLRILHANLTFSRNINKQYNSDFANSGATMSGKIGTSLRVRKPNRYTVRTGAAINVQDTTEDYVTVNCATQKGVDMRFSSADLTMTIDDFSERYIKPAALLLASTIDYDGLTLYQNVYNTVGTYNAVPNSLLTWLEGGALMSNFNAPTDSRYAVMTPYTQATMVDALKGLYNPSATVGGQNASGSMGNWAGLDWSYSQNINTHTCGTRVASGQTTTNGATVSGAASVVCTTGSAVTFKKGDVFYFNSGTAVNAVNPETKADTGVAQQFVVTADVTAVSTDVTLAISPSIITSGATQTVTAVPDASAQIVFIGAASSTYKNNMVYHPDAFTLVTADLVLPKGVDFAAREVYDGISARIIRQYDINTDNLPCRLDVFYGWTTLYPQLACRVVGSK